MKNFKFVLLLIVISFYLSSCGEPPTEAKEVSLLEWITIMIPRLNSVKNDRKGRKNLGKELENTIDIISFYKNNTIKLKSKKDKTSDFLYTIENNSFLSKKGMYITFADNQMYFSLDKINWVVFNFSLMPPPEEKEEKPENFKADYLIEYNYDKKNGIIEIDYTIAFTPTNTMQTIKLKENKPIFSLSKDMVLVDKDVKNTTIDLKKNILYIPENTIFSGNMNINGNIVETNTVNGFITIKSLRDIFVYVKNKMLSLSFNRKKWSLSILSLKFSPSVTIKSVSDKKIQFDFFLDISYSD